MAGHSSDSRWSNSHPLFHFEIQKIPHIGTRNIEAEGGSQNQSNIDKESDLKRQRQIDIIIWILFLADGTNGLLDIVEQTGFNFNEIKEVALLLESKGLVVSK